MGPGWRFAAGGGGGWDGAFDVRAGGACVEVAGDGRDGYWRLALVAALATREAGFDADEPIVDVLTIPGLRRLSLGSLLVGSFAERTMFDLLVYSLGAP